MLIPNIKDKLNLGLPIKGYESEKICLIFKKKGEPPKIQRIFIKITPSNSAYPRAIL